MKKLKYVIFIVTLVLCGCSNQTLSDDIEDIDDSFIKDSNEVFNSEDEVVNYNEEEAILISLSDDNISASSQVVSNNHHISVGKMELITKIIKHSNIYCEDDIKALPQLSIHKLDLIFQSLNIVLENEIISDTKLSI